MSLLRSTFRVALFSLVFLGLVAHICELPAQAWAPTVQDAEATAQEDGDHHDGTVHEEASCEAIRPVSVAPSLPVVHQRVAIPLVWLQLSPRPPAAPTPTSGSPPLYLVHSALLI